MVAKPVVVVNEFPCEACLRKSGVTRAAVSQLVVVSPNVVLSPIVAVSLNVLLSPTAVVSQLVVVSLRAASPSELVRAVAKGVVAARAVNRNAVANPNVVSSRNAVVSRVVLPKHENNRMVSVTRIWLHS